MKKLFVIFSVAVGVIMGGMTVGKLAIYRAYADEIVSPQAAELPEIYIKAVNPGYTVDGKSNVGEMIELGRRDGSDTPISLAGITVGYTPSDKEPLTLVEFPAHSYMTGETLLLRYASSPGSELAAMTYKVAGGSSGITQSAGPLALMRDGEVVDAVCWNGAEGCYRKFKGGSGESLVRDLETGEFEFRTDYVPAYDDKSYYVEEGYGGGSEDVAEVVGVVMPQCRGVRFSEILSYYEVAKAEQFIEIYNGGSEQVLLDGCAVRYKNKKYLLNGILPAEGYAVYCPSELGFSLTKNPTNSNVLELVDVDGVVVNTLIYPNGQRKGTAYAFIGYDSSGKELWKVTYAPTPGSANNYQEFKTCEAGKVLNEATGNCVKATTVAEKICGEGQYLNLLTGRCKKYETATEKTCKEGYYLNPDTGRCRKIVENNGAEYNIEPEEYEETQSFVGLYAVLGVAVVGMGYLIYEFRHEIVRLWHKVFR